MPWPKPHPAPANDVSVFCFYYHTQNSQPRTEISNAFSDTVRLEVSRLSSAQCWSCSTTETEFAHVIAQNDGQVPCWIEAGLLPFSLNAVTNCIQLCPTCHAAFDRSDDPRWMFLPTDLNFFMRHEFEDRRRRAQTDPSFSRIVPTAKDYRDHHTSKGLQQSIQIQFRFISDSI
ncbi:hypothetical protein ACN38_g12330 [Penicillium nordicum]|uniref:HNH nuclease domain-containing protein n=1 Tax=Penicillium nordicum TaxID=229535 RepID=A0A0M8NTD5_9EURO|nr:hypothetical protein ACN38_g12330 [Penicillium nordicum]